MNVLPQAIATGCIHIGTMIGKLNGVMPATTPMRLAERVRVDAAGDLIAVLALEQLRDAGGELDDLPAADHLAPGVVERLAVLGADDRRELVLVLDEQLAEREHDARARRHRRLAPRLERRGCRVDRRVDVVGRRQAHLGLGDAAGGIEHVAQAIALSWVATCR